MSSALLLSLIVFLPCLGALVLSLVPLPKEATKVVSLVFTILVLLLVGWMCVAGPGPGSASFAPYTAAMQHTFAYDWIPSFDVYYSMGLDGISFPLVVLTAGLSVLSMLASWNIDKQTRVYCVLYLILVTGMLGVFVSLDFILFYVFWEVMLLPMYFLIGIWGGPRKEYAAIKFFLYTLVGGVLMLIAILLLYFHSNVADPLLANFVKSDAIVAKTAGTQLFLQKSDLTSVEKLDLAVTSLSAEDPEIYKAFEAKFASAREALVKDPKGLRATVQMLLSANPDLAVAIGRASLLQLAKANGDAAKAGQPIEEVHTFNILALQQIGQHTTQFHRELRLFGADWEIDGIKLTAHSIQWWAFVLLFIGFIIKVPSVPFHTWLPDAHVEAPTPISMILAGVLLKMGGYGIIRICYPICPDAGYDLAYVVALIGVVSILYGAFAAMAQDDFKRLVAYSSVSHMGYVVLGLAVWSVYPEAHFRADYWAMGMNAAMFQMIGHGVSSAGMFFMVGVIYDRVHHRDLNKFGGLFHKMPVYSGLAFVIFFAGLGLPGLCGFIGEVFVVLAVWKYDYTLAILSASAVILTAGYILWALQRVYLGAEYKGPHPEALTPITPRELSIAIPLVFFAILLGVYPQTVFRYMEPTVTQTANDLAAWTKNDRLPRDHEIRERELERLRQEMKMQPDQAEAPAATVPVPVTNAAEPVENREAS